MKTAVEYIELRLLGIASFDSEELRLRYKDIIKQAKEKEKEQIIEARDGREISSFTTGKDYYDLNFNHHIEPEPNTYTNFTPHNANAVAEYNEGLKNFTPNK